MAQRALLLALMSGIAWHVPLPAMGADPQASPLKPADAVRSFRLADDKLQIELVAAEPDVVSPVAVAWDEDGRMFVAEMSDYPQGPGGGRIKLLQDPDEGGRYRKVTVFADRLNFPTSVLPWKGGVLVSAAPNIWFLKDADGDGKADERRVVLTGFSEGNTQLRVNSLLGGLDNWVYGANGRSDGNPRRPGDPPEKAVSIRRRDFRFRPDTGAVEAVAGGSQFGLARDDWGQRFLSWNTQPLRHVVLEDRYLSRNPNLAAASSVASIADPADQGKLFPICPPPATFNREPVEFYNASCGTTVFRGDLLGPAYQGNWFVCEPLTSLVQRRALTPAGVTFVAKRTEQGKEFLASTDPWFHAVNLATGPDGALYVVDFYRQWVEHPQYVPENLRKTIDWRKGAEHGRIWRIRPRDAKLPAPPRLGSAPTAELVGHLGHANGWQRDTAQRLLVQRQDKAAVPLLREGARQAPAALARLHALWALDGLGSLDEESVTRALADGHPQIRVQALRLAEGRLRDSAVVGKSLAALADDRDPRVRFQTALVLGEWKDPSKLRLLARIAQRDSNDEWHRLAVLSSLQETWPFFRDLVEQQQNWLDQPSTGQVQFLGQLAALLAARNQEAELAECLTLLGKAPKGLELTGRLAVLAGLAEGLERTGRPMRSLLSTPPPRLEVPVRGLSDLLASAGELALAEGRPVADRVLAIQALTRTRPEALGKALVELLGPRQPAAVQVAAARGLADASDPVAARQALEGWGTFTLAARREVLTALLRSPELTAVLVEAVEQDKLAVTDLDPAARQLLARLPNPELRTRAQKFLTKAQPANRQEVLRKYQPALERAGDRQRGASLFATHCLTCHSLQDQGHRVGPDLAGVASRPKAMLLEDLLDPSKEVAPDFIGYTLLTKRGQVLSGLLATETATSIKLRRAEGGEDTVLRSEIQELRATGKSLMPEGLEQNLSIQDVADLLEFLLRPVPFPLPPGKRGK